LPAQQPVFVYGALRSGTTVFRLMLDAHGRIGNPGEVDFLFDHLHPDPVHPGGWRYDLAALRLDRIFQSHGLTLPAGRDGADLLGHLIGGLVARGGPVVTLNIHRHIDRLRALLPEARIIHMLRDPRDVARSAIGMGWAAGLYDGVDHWLETEYGWSGIAAGLAPDRVFELRYEALLADPARELARVCGFLGLAYDPDMLRYHERSSYGPPDRALAEQWRHRSGPAELALLEGKAGALMATRGYIPTGPGRVPGLWQRLGLWASHKRAVWTHGIRHHGPTVYFGEKVTRKLGLSGLHRPLRQRMNRVETTLLR
jgi:hypothetical protein